MIFEISCSAELACDQKKTAELPWGVQLSFPPCWGQAGEQSGFPAWGTGVDLRGIPQQNSKPNPKTSPWKIKDFNLGGGIKILLLPECMSQRSRPIHLSTRALFAIDSRCPFLQNGGRCGSVGNALPKHLRDWCLIAEGGGWRCEQGRRFKITLRREERSQFFFFLLRWTCTSQKWHKLFSAGRGNCHFPLEWLSPGTCIRFATAVWKKMFPCCQSSALQASNWKKLYNAQVGTCRKRNKLFSQGRAN